MGEVVGVGESVGNALENTELVVGAFERTVAGPPGLVEVEDLGATPFGLWPPAPSRVVFPDSRPAQPEDGPGGHL